MPVSHARMDWNLREIVRNCDVCGYKATARCYPSTGENQTKAWQETADDLREHLLSHTPEEIERYLERIHQV